MFSFWLTRYFLLLKFWSTLFFFGKALEDADVQSCAMRCVVMIPVLLLVVVFYQGTNPPDRSEKAGNPSEKSQKEIKQLVTMPDSTHAAVREPQGNPKQNSTNNSDNNVAHWFNYLNAAATTVSAFFAFLVWLVYRAMLRATKINERAWIVLSCLSWNWRRRSSVKITERTHAKRAKTLHRRREGRHSETALVG